MCNPVQPLFLRGWHGTHISERGMCAITTTLYNPHLEGCVQSPTAPFRGIAHNEFR